MNLEQLIKQFELITDTEEGFDQIRSIILDLAVRGKLTKQNEKDTHASKLLKTIKRKRDKLYENGEIRKQSNLPEIAEDEIPCELPQNWSWERLGNVGIVNPRIDADEALEASFVPMKLISEDFSDHHDFEVRKWGDIRKGYTHFGENDVGMAKITPCFENGKAAIFRNLKNGIGAGTTELYVFRAIPETIFPEYVYSFIQSARFKALGKTKMTGTAGQQRVPRNYFEEALFPVPPVEEQQRIVQKIETLFTQVDELEQKVQQDQEVDERLQVAVLDDLQSAKTPKASRQSWQRLTDHFEQIYRKPEHIDQLKQAILNEAVRGRLVPQDSNDEPAEKLLERIKEKKQRLYEEGEFKKPRGAKTADSFDKPYEIPKNWEWVCLNEVFDVRDGTHDTPTYQDEGVPLVTSKNIYDGVLSLEDVKYISEEDHEKISQRSDVQVENILFAMIGSIGNSVILDRADFSIKNVALFKYFDRDLSCPKYLKIFLDHSERAMKEEASGGVQSFVSLTYLRNFLFPLPPLEEQKRIVDKVDELFAWCDGLKEKLSRSQKTDQRLLEALVNGRKAN